MKLCEITHMRLKKKKKKKRRGNFALEPQTRTKRIKHQRSADAPVEIPFSHWRNMIFVEVYLWECLTQSFGIKTIRSKAFERRRKKVNLSEFRQ